MNLQLTTEPFHEVKASIPDQNVDWSVKWCFWQKMFAIDTNPLPVHIIHHSSRRSCWMVR